MNFHIASNFFFNSLIGKSECNMFNERLEKYQRGLARGYLLKNCISSTRFERTKRARIISSCQANEEKKKRGESFLSTLRSLSRVYYTIKKRRVIALVSTSNTATTNTPPAFCTFLHLNLAVHRPSILSRYSIFSRASDNLIHFLLTLIFIGSKYFFILDSHSNWLELSRRCVK